MVGSFIFGINWCSFFLHCVCVVGWDTCFLVPLPVGDCLVRNWNHSCDKQKFIIYSHYIYNIQANGDRTLSVVIFTRIEIKDSRGC